MAAVAGVLFRDPSGGPEVVRRMLEAAPHRGAEIEIASLGRCILGIVNDAEHREATLAVRGDHAVAFTGVLDNPEDLASRLPPRNGGRRAASTAELVLDAFEQSGDSLLPSLRGNFACLISDGRYLRAFRDQIGFESLFERDDPRGVYVATEAKQVLAGAGVAPEPDVELVEALFYADAQDAVACPLRGVRRLLTGTLLTANGDSITRRRYWDPSSLLETARLSPAGVAERFRELFSQAVRRVLTGSDIVALSGGIDSPPISSFGNREHLRLFDRPLPAIAEVFPSHPSCDESRYIELVAGRLDIPLHTYEPGRQRLDGLQDWVRLFDGPWTSVSPDGTSQRLREARRLGFRTVLTGEYAEAVTSAGQWYLVPHLITRGRFRAAASQLASQRSVGFGRRRLGYQVLDAFTPAFVNRRRLLRWKGYMIPSWVDERRIAEREASRIQPIRRRWTSFQLPFYEGGIHGEVDNYTHALHGIRPRRPWADLDLWEFFISLPAEVKFPDYRMKGLARTILRDEVPDEILDRTDKTNTNEYFRSMCLDYPSLRRWLIAPGYHVPGVDYARLADELGKEDMSLAHYLWARDLAAVHAFLDLWS